VNQSSFSIISSPFSMLIGLYVMLHVTFLVHNVTTWSWGFHMVFTLL